jgi:hypothetical protein
MNLSAISDNTLRSNQVNIYQSLSLHHI